MVVWTVQLDNRRHGGDTLELDSGVTSTGTTSPISSVESIVANLSKRYIRFESSLPAVFRVALSSARGMCTRQQSAVSVWYG